MNNLLNGEITASILKEADLLKDYYKVNKVYNEYLSQKIQTLPWREFQRMFPFSQNAPLFTEIRHGGPQVTLTDLKAWLDANAQIGASTTLDQLNSDPTFKIKVKEKGGSTDYKEYRVEAKIREVEIGWVALVDYKGILQSHSKVNPEYQSKGLGRLLYDKAITIAKEKGYERLYCGETQTADGKRMWDTLSKRYPVKAYRGRKYITLKQASLLKKADVPEDLMKPSVPVSKEYDAVRRVYQWYTDNNKQTLPWREFQKIFQQLAQKYTALFTEIRHNKPQITKDDLGDYLEAALTDAQPTNYALDYSTYNDAETSFRDVEQLVIQINQSASAEQILAQDPVIRDYVEMVCQGGQQSGHPVGLKTVGWLRVDFVNSEWLLIDEIQSDLVNSVTQARSIVTEPTFDSFVEHLTNDKVRDVVLEKVSPELFDGLKRHFRQKGYTPEKLEQIKDKMVELFEDWAEYGISSLIDIARKHGIKYVALHTAETIAMRDESVEADKVKMYYDNIAKSFGFKKQQVDVDDFHGNFWVRTASVKDPVQAEMKRFKKGTRVITCPGDMGGDLSVAKILYSEDEWGRGKLLKYGTVVDDPEHWISEEDESHVCENPPRCVLVKVKWDKDENERDNGWQHSHHLLTEEEVKAPQQINMFSSDKTASKEMTNLMNKFQKGVEVVDSETSGTYQNGKRVGIVLKTMISHEKVLVLVKWTNSVGVPGWYASHYLETKKEFDKTHSQQSLFASDKKQVLKQINKFKEGTEVVEKTTGKTGVVTHIPKLDLASPSGQVWIGVQWQSGDWWWCNANDFLTKEEAAQPTQQLLFSSVSSDKKQVFEQIKKFKKGTEVVQKPTKKSGIVTKDAQVNGLGEAWVYVRWKNAETSQWYKADTLLTKEEFNKPEQKTLFGSEEDTKAYKKTFKKGIRVRKRFATEDNDEGTVVQIEMAQMDDSKCLVAQVLWDGSDIPTWWYAEQLMAEDEYIANKQQSLFGSEKKADLSPESRKYFTKKFKRGTRVRAAFFVNNDKKPKTGVVVKSPVFDEVFPGWRAMVSVLWDGENDPVDVNVSLLTTEAETNIRRQQSLFSSDKTADGQSDFIKALMKKFKKGTRVIDSYRTGTVVTTKKYPVESHIGVLVQWDQSGSFPTWTWSNNIELEENRFAGDQIEMFSSEEDKYAAPDTAGFKSALLKTADEWTDFVRNTAIEKVRKQKQKQNERLKRLKEKNLIKQKWQETELPLIKEERERQIQDKERQQKHKQVEEQAQERQKKIELHDYRLKHKDDPDFSNDYELHLPYSPRLPNMDEQEERMTFNEEI